MKFKKALKILSVNNQEATDAIEEKLEKTMKRRESKTDKATQTTEVLSLKN